MSAKNNKKYTVVSKSTGKKITFMLSAPDARKVTLAGTFNDWSSESAPLKRGKDNIWKRQVALRPGRYEYKFIVDGDWWNDPNNSNLSWNDMGSQNSVIEIQ